MVKSGDFEHKVKIHLGPPRLVLEGVQKALPVSQLRRGGAKRRVKVGRSRSGRRSCCCCCCCGSAFVKNQAKRWRILSNSSCYTCGEIARSSPFRITSMDAKDPRRSSDDPTNEQRSFGSNCLPQSQSQNKISIGILAEPTQKLNSGVKDDEPAFTSAKNEAQCRNLLVENFKQTATKYLPGETAQVCGKEHPFLQNNSNADKQSNDISSQQSGKKAKNNMEKNEELEGATVQETNELNKGKQEEKQGERAAQRSNRTLRMKLSEILETASSPTKKSVSFETPSKVENGLKLEGHFHQNNIKAANSRRDTDTIENDSVGPNANETKRRPVTRLLMKKEATNKPKPVRMTNHPIGNRGDLPNSSIGGRGGGLKRKNIFSFSEDIWSQNVNVASDVNTSTMFYKKGGRHNSGLEQKKNCAFQTTEKRQREKTELPAQKPSSDGRSGNSFDHLSRDEQKDLHPMNGVVKEIHNSPARKKKYQKDVNGPELHGESGLREYLHCFSSKNNEGIHFEDNNLEMGVETPIQNQSRSPCLSAARRKQSEPGAHSPAATEKQPGGKDLTSSSTFWNSKASSFRFDVEPESSDGFEEFKTPTIRKSSFDDKEKLSDGMPQSSAEHDIDSFEDHTIKKEPKPMWTPESDDCETSSFLLRSTKMPHGQGAVRTKEFNSILPSLKGTPESNGLEGPSDAQNGDSLARAVSLFASALEKVRTKMKLLVIKKSVEVLESVAQETELQLQNVESQIATDIEKFTILEEPKRKTLEKKFQEQQECLSVMYQRFKEDMNKHFEDCQKTLEELEIYQREQKGGAGKLKSQHKKLLLQVEEGIGSQISDAERRIMIVAQHKMLQLRHVIREFLSKDN
ncbi:hypothetical protein Sjap_021240 [Stephania japonica]|uniref:Meiosis-specific protein ASY3-like coiled-coil domain-containing protein n=1 Tax=Stephania japonica TaxID=461633 RepID=A0AAP0HNV1_9MAGN